MSKISLRAIAQPSPGSFEMNILVKVRVHQREREFT
jgi:hypothetical protein